MGDDSSLKSRKKSHAPFAGKKSRLDSGRGSSQSSQETITKDGGSRLTRHLAPLDADEVEQAFVKKMGKMFKGKDIIKDVKEKPGTSESNRNPTLKIDLSKGGKVASRGSKRG